MGIAALDPSYVVTACARREKMCRYACPEGEGENGPNSQSRIEERSIG